MSIIISFWKANPDYWIAIGPKTNMIDNDIKEKFWNFDYSKENLIGKIIYLDQFSRHFSRLGLIDENTVHENRIKACELFDKNITINFDEIEITFALMPFKHLKKYTFIFDYLCNEWLNGRKLLNLPILHKFYIDTYKKAFADKSFINDNVTINHSLEKYDHNLICDFYPINYTQPDWLTENKNIFPINRDKFKKLLDPLYELSKRTLLTISLSGGVDSMTMLLLLKIIGMTRIEAIHIVYGNRQESEHEYRFIAEYCNLLNVKLHVYRIKWLKRGEIDREFYEEITRVIRFNVYNLVSDNILLGHIKDDIVENVWSNIAFGNHLDNLKKMSPEEVHLNVNIIRPWLEVDKTDIYNASILFNIPYLKNTTPSWSNRGKFREKFHQATIDQYGPGIDNKIIEFANTIGNQTKMLEILLYNSIYNSFSQNKIDISSAVAVNLNAHGWLKIFEYACHKWLKISRPSIKSVKYFVDKLAFCKGGIGVEMNKNLSVKVTSNGLAYFMEFIVK
jgi:tRNA(Ile)-lysidine synthetase-like protein